MGKPKNFADWPESDFDSSNRPRSSSVEFWNENYVAPARKYRERYRRMTQEEKKREWRSYPDPLLNPGCTLYWFGWAQDPSLAEAEEPENEASNSSHLYEYDSDYLELTEAQEAQTESSGDAVEDNSYIDLMIETAPSDAIRLQLIKECNELSVEDYLKDIQELYSPDTTIDTSLYQYRMPQLPDSMLSPFLQGGWEWDYETFRSTQEYLREREEIIAQLEAQAQLEQAEHAYKESLVPQPDATDVTGGRIPTLQHVLREWKSLHAPVSELILISKFDAIKALERYFLSGAGGAPGDRINHLLSIGQGGFIPGVEAMKEVKKGDLVHLIFASWPDVPRYVEKAYMTDDEYALKLLRKYVTDYKSPFGEVAKIKLYLEQVENWKKLTDNAPLPVGYGWFLGEAHKVERPYIWINFNQHGPLNYVPPEADAYDIASLGTLKENLYSDEFFAGQEETLAMDNGTFGISDSTPDEASLYRNQDSVGEPGCTQAPNSTVEIESVNNIKLSLDEFERMFLKISKQESQTAIC